MSPADRMLAVSVLAVFMALLVLASWGVVATLRELRAKWIRRRPRVGLPGHRKADWRSR